MSMITEIEPVQVQIVGSRKIRGMGLTTFSTPIQAMSEPLNNCMFHSLKSKSNNSRHIFHPFDKDCILESVDHFKHLADTYKESAIQRAAPIEVELKLEIPAPVELKSLYNLTQRNAVTQIYAFVNLLYSLGSNNFTNYIDDKDWKVIDKEYGLMKKIVTALLNAKAAPELPELGILKPSANLNYVKLYEPSPERPMTFVGDVRDTEIVPEGTNT